eukprot:2558727-Rhodomonas_salina.3
MATGALWTDPKPLPATASTAATPLPLPEGECPLLACLGPRLRSPSSGSEPFAFASCSDASL